MAGITGLGTTYNLPNYTGLLYRLTPADTPFFSAIGGLNGGGQTTSTEFEWQTYDLRTADQNVRLEGATAPTAEERVRGNVTNVTQVHQEKISVSYSKSAAVGLKAGTNNALGNPVQNELDWQTEQMLKQMVRDVEYSFLRGVYQKPSDNTTPRKTRGLLAAITTNVITVDSDTGTAGNQAGPLTTAMVDELAAKVYDSGGIMEAGTATLLAGSKQRRALTALYADHNHYTETSRTVGGVTLQLLYTDFAVFNVMLDRHMPADTLALCSLEMCRPVFLEVPNKGHFFSEPLARTGASDEVQLYGEVGLDYGNEKSHGKIVNLS